ncbi:hypothetical protein N0V95_007704 [Ascochyta clinopodiicola]|nr:hypothetical protein N0V95_007704 [Ascochyta clinopodiicola]
MAIIPSIPGLDVTIEVDNTALPEHEYEDEDTTTTPNEIFDDSATKYLEVPSGAEFSVRWLLKPPFEPTAAIHATVMLDGFFLNAPVRETADKDNIRGYKYAKTTSKEGGQDFTQSFRFSELEIGKYNAFSFDHFTTDRSADDSTSRTTRDLKRQLEGIGCITVYFYQVMSETKSQMTVVPQLELARCDPMSEKIAQKGAPTLGDVLTHQARYILYIARSEHCTDSIDLTSLTAPQAVHASLLVDIETENAPFATYNFHYRSTRALRSLGVIPRTPSPTLSPAPRPDARDPATMTREELIAALTTEVRIKREREDDDDLVWIGTRPAKKRAFVMLEN